MSSQKISVAGSIISFLESEGFNPVKVLAEDKTAVIDSENEFIKNIGNYRFSVVVCHQTNPMFFAFETTLNDERISKEFDRVLMAGVEDVKFYLSKSFDYNRIVSNIVSNNRQLAI